jgi:hypothetical protein
MSRLTRFVVVVVLTVAIGAGIYGTVGLSDTDANRNVSIEVVEQSNGIVAIEAENLQTAGNETKIATVTNQGNRRFEISETITGQPTRNYGLYPGQSSDVFVDIDCENSSERVYDIKIFAETEDSSGNLRIESTTTVSVQCI